MKIWRSTQYCSAPGADMDSRVVIDVFFAVTDEWLAENSHLYGSQRNIGCNHYLWEYPVLISGVLSKKKIRMVRNIRSTVFNFNRHVKRLHKHYPLPVF